MTDQYAVIGHPIEHSVSPFIHGLFARQTGQDMSYRKLDIAPENLTAEVRQFFLQGGRGLNVTVPHKQAIVEMIAELSPRAERAGAVNTVALQEDGRLFGDNTDGVGLVRDLRDNLMIDVHLRSVLICGAGGAARGVLAPLLALEPKIVLIANRTAPRAQQLAGMFGDLGVVRGCGLDDLPAEPFDLIINATSAGLSGELPPLDPRIIGPHTVCYDMSYGREATPFLRWAQAQGAQHCIKGWGMLVEQAAESFMLWRGVRPDTRAVIAILEEGR